MEPTLSEASATLEAPGLRAGGGGGAPFGGFAFGIPMFRDSLQFLRFRV